MIIVRKSALHNASIVKKKLHQKYKWNKTDVANERNTVTLDVIEDNSINTERANQTTTHKLKFYLDICV